MKPEYSTQLTEDLPALRRFRFVLVSLLLGGSTLTMWLDKRASVTPGFGFVIGRSHSRYLNDVVQPLGLSSTQGRWMRADSIPEPTAANHAAVAAERTALRNLRALGFKSCIVLRFGVLSWKNGVRPGGGYRLPVDLREAYDKGAAFAHAYGDLVDIWEIDNEPDISFVEDNPEAFASYHKAFYFGLRSVIPTSSSLFQSTYADIAKPKVLMAPMALPPGPYFERLLANDLLSYSNGINYHYYGYAEDFTGVYNQFKNAVAGFSNRATASHIRRKELPVFLTEYGYGLLSGPASITEEGRERQRRWFSEVAHQISRLQPEGPMAFYLSPYIEIAHNEFGLLQREPVTSVDSFAKPLVTGEFASPALRALWDYAAVHPYKPRNWTARLPAPSPIIIDFLPSRDLKQIKSHLGYQADGKDGARLDTNIGNGRFILYNFDSNRATGIFEVAAEEYTEPVFKGRVTLLPGEALEIPVTLPVSNKSLSIKAAKAIFTSENSILSDSRWATNLLPSSSGMMRHVAFAFDHVTAEAAENAKLLSARPVAKEEPSLRPMGRWFVSTGVEVKETDGSWRFEISALPQEPLRPAMAELPLPSSFRFSAGQILNFAYRLGNSQAMNEPKRPMLDVYFRTATGNLYQVWPRQFPTNSWQNYWQHAENFTLGFFGRAEGSWRFAEQRPVALVFFLRPTRLPAVFEIGNPGIVTFAKP